MACPSFENLLSLQQNQLEEDRKLSVMKHLSDGCEVCAENFRWIGEVITLARQDESFTFSEDVVRWSVAQFKVASAEHVSLPQFLARLVFDSLGPARFADVRSTPVSSGSSRQMLFRADMYDVDVRIEQAERQPGVYVIGQILCGEKRPGELSGFEVRMARPDDSTGAAAALQTSTDSRGMFRLTTVSAGEYDLHIRVPEGEIHVPAIHV